MPDRVWFDVLKRSLRVMTRLLTISANVDVQLHSLPSPSGLLEFTGRVGVTRKSLQLRAAGNWKNGSTIGDSSGRAYIDAYFNDEWKEAIVDGSATNLSCLAVQYRTAPFAISRIFIIILFLFYLCPHFLHRDWQSQILPSIQLRSLVQPIGCRSNNI